MEIKSKFKIGDQVWFNVANDKVGSRFIEEIYAIVNQNGHVKIEYKLTGQSWNVAQNDLFGSVGELEKHWSLVFSGRLANMVTEAKSYLK